MEPYGSSATAMLVATPEDVRERPDAATVTVGRDEIEEALASDAPLELILSVGRDAGAPQDVRVAWQRSDLETVLAGADAGGVTFSFDRAKLARALEQPDFEGHGIREMVLLTVAAASASAAMAVSTASGQLLEGTSGGGAAAAVVAPGHGEATTARDLAAASVVAPGHGEASTAGVLAASAAIHDEATPAARGVDQIVPGADEATLASRGIGTEPAVSPGHGEASTASSLASIAGIHDEATPAARGVGQTVPGADEATLAARGIEAPVAHDEATLAARGIETPAPVASSTGFELPSLDSGGAAAIGGLAGAGLLILGAAFAARRQGARPA